MRIVPAVVLLLGLAILSAATAPAHAGIRRCVDGNGVSVYTDRDCSELDAVAQVGFDSRGVADADAMTAFGARGTGDMTPRGCARNAVSLLEGVRGALEAGDVNRLAAYYHWSGVSQGSARHLMTKLEAVAARPLVAAALAYPESEPAPEPASEGFRLYEWPELRESPVADTADDEGDDEADWSPPPVPVALELEQMSGHDDVGSRSVRFALHHHAGCWWIRF